MFSLDVLEKGYEALKPFGVEMPQQEPTGQLENRKIVPWSYYLLGIGALGGVITAISAYILKQTALFPLATGATILMGLGAYEIKQLCLTKLEASQIQSYAGLIDLFTTQVKKFSEEKKEFDQSNTNLKTEIESLKTENLQIEKLTGDVKAANAATADVTLKLQDQMKKYEEINIELQNEIQLINKAKSDLSNLSNEEQAIVNQFTTENGALKQNLEQLKENEAILQKSLAQYQSTNKTLLDEIEDLKKSNLELKTNISQITEQNNRLDSSYKQLTEADEKLKNDLKQREELEIRLEETAAKLEKKVQKLSDIKKLKIEYEEKLALQQKNIEVLKEENDHLKQAQSQTEPTPISPITNTTHDSQPLVPTVKIKAPVSFSPLNQSPQNSPNHSPRKPHASHFLPKAVNAETRGDHSPIKKHRISRDSNEKK